MAPCLSEDEKTLRIYFASDAPIFGFQFQLLCDGGLMDYIRPLQTEGAAKSAGMEVYEGQGTILGMSFSNKHIDATQGELMALGVKAKATQTFSDCAAICIDPETTVVAAEELGAAFAVGLAPCPPPKGSPLPLPSSPPPPVQQPSSSPAHVQSPTHKHVQPPRSPSPPPPPLEKPPSPKHVQPPRSPSPPPSPLEKPSAPTHTQPHGSDSPSPVHTVPPVPPAEPQQQPGAPNDHQADPVVVVATFPNPPAGGGDDEVLEPGDDGLPKNDAAAEHSHDANFGVMKCALVGIGCASLIAFFISLRFTKPRSKEYHTLDKQESGGSFFIELQSLPQEASLP